MSSNIIAMKKPFCDYLMSLYQNIPTTVFEGLLSVFFLGSVLILAFLGGRRGLKHIAMLLLIEYVFLLFCSTVLFRKTSAVIWGYDFHPFWSYAAIRQGLYSLISENIMNVVVFVPVGILLGIVIQTIKWWRVLLIGCGISICIEVLQFVTHRGFSEFDDVFHNSLGCLIGFWIYRLFVASSSRLILSVNLRL